MASTFEVAPPRPLGADSYLNELTHYDPEGATQTFVDGAFVRWTSGYLVEAASPATAVIGIAVEPGHNAAADGDNFLAYVPVWAQPRFFANFLLAGDPVGTPEVLAVGDMLVDTQIVKATISGTVYWFVNTTTSTTAAKMISLLTDQHPRNVSAGMSGRNAVYGDTDARVLFEVLEAIRQAGI